VSGVQPDLYAPFANTTREIQANGVTIFRNGQPEAPEKILAALHPGDNLLTFLAASQADGNGGFSGEFALMPVPCAGGESVDLDKSWTIWTDETNSYETDFPASGHWLMARKSVWIPEQYRDRDVWIEVRALVPSHATGVATNGRFRYDSVSYGARFRRNPLLINITPDIHFGQENEIVLAAPASTTSSQSATATSNRPAWSSSRRGRSREIPRPGAWALPFASDHGRTGSTRFQVSVTLREAVFSVVNLRLCALAYRETTHPSSAPD
jgi:hypothetical protein